MEIFFCFYFPSLWENIEFKMLYGYGAIQPMLMCLPWLQQPAKKEAERVRTNNGEGEPKE